MAATKAKRDKSASRRRAEPTAGDYVREAVTQWRRAAKLALKARNGGAPARKNTGSKKRDKGGPAGSAADALLARLGTPGRAASKLSVGSRLAERLRPDLPSFGGNGDGEELPVPIQVAIDIAAPVRVVYEQATSFEDYPEFVDPVESAKTRTKKKASFEVQLHGHSQTVAIELTDVRPEQRIDWESREGPSHAGTVSFHELAPRLTHLEVSVDLEPAGVVQRLTRAVHLTEHAIRTELRRFKAHVELLDDADWDEPEKPEGEDEPEEPVEPEAETDDSDEELDGEELDDEEPEGEAYVDEIDDEHHEAYEEVGR